MRAAALLDRRCAPLPPRFCGAPRLASVVAPAAAQPPRGARRLAAVAASGVAPPSPPPAASSPPPPSEPAAADAAPRRRVRKLVKAKEVSPSGYGSESAVASLWLSPEAEEGLPELADVPEPSPASAPPPPAAAAAGGVLQRLRAAQAAAAAPASAAPAAPAARRGRVRIASGDAAGDEAAAAPPPAPAARAPRAPPSGPVATVSLVEALQRKFRERRDRSLARVRAQFASAGDASPGEEGTLFSDGGGSLGAGGPARPQRLSNSIDWRSLAVGEFVVHKQYGVGEYLGMRKVCVLSVTSLPPFFAPADAAQLAPRAGEPPEEYLFIKFSDATAKLRATSAVRLIYRRAPFRRRRSRRRYTLPPPHPPRRSYRSAGETGGRPPKLSALNDPNTWQRRQARGRLAIQKLVNTLMDVYLERVMITRPAYPPVGAELAKSFEAAFPYPLTGDQRLAVQDLEADMDRDSPMDRLVIGDVGFGKTEVAMYAVLRALAAGRQVAVLAPTTVLAKQHAKLFSERFTPLGFPCASLTRYTTAGERRAAVEGLASGRVRLVTGTHALLSEAGAARDLGLLVVDEEQRFGVRHKEAIQELHSRVDVLTLSATPIPRTLHMALAGFRDTSIIATPPPGRRPINTQLCPFDEQELVRAVSAEVARGGQVFYVVPRIEAFSAKLERLARLMPTLRVKSAHGRMAAATLEDVFDSFADAQFDLLLCTTIVEAGLDLPRVNTIVIEDVNLLGLSSLYQLRGRVGRSTIQAHALLMWDPSITLTDESMQRLDAIRESCGMLGQGFRIAERDMAIRGVGAVFGDKQSGDLAGVGVDLYLEMLYEQLAGVETQRLPAVVWDEVDLGPLGVHGAVPPAMVASPAEAARLVARCAEAGREGPAALKSLLRAVEEATGAALPRPLHALLRINLLRWCAAEMGVHGLSSPAPGLLLLHSDMSEGTFECIASLLPETERGALSWQAGQLALRVSVLPSEQAAWARQPDMLVERAIVALQAMQAVAPKFLKYV